MKKTTITEIANLLKGLNSALIFCHVNPDGDTLSCAFALKYVFEKIGKKADVVSSFDLPEKYAMTGVFGDVMSEPVSGYDGYIAVDCSTEGQVGAPYAFFAKQKKTFNIDHHVSNTLYAEYNYVVDQAANTINVFQIINEMGVEIDLKIAKTLMLGLLTDTGNFAHCDAVALETGAKLCRIGVDLTEMNILLYSSQKKSRAMMYLEVMSGIRFFNDDQIAVITISQEQLSRFGMTKSDTEGFTDFPMSIGSVKVGVSVFENRRNCYKLSLRSKGVNVNEIAATFGGGGHVRASGCMLNGYLEDVIDKIVFTIGNYL